MKVEIISCLQDNYSYLIIDEINNVACVVDPSEAKPVIDYVEKKNLDLLFWDLMEMQKGYQRLISY